MESGVKYSETDDGEVTIESVTLPLLDDNKAYKFESRKELGEFIKVESSNIAWMKSLDGHMRIIGQTIHGYITTNFLTKLDQINHNWASNDKDTLGKHLDILKDQLQGVNYPYQCRAIFKLFNEQHENVKINLFHLVLVGTESISYQKNKGKSLTTILMEGSKRDSANFWFFELEPARLKAARLLEEFESTGAVGGKDELKTRLSEVVSIKETAQEKLYDFEAWIDDTGKQIILGIEEKEEQVRKRHIQTAQKVLKAARNLRSRSKQLQEEAVSTVKVAEETFHSQIELDSSVKYWETKAKNHQTLSKQWLSAIIFSLIAMIVVPPILALCFARNNAGVGDVVNWLGGYDPMQIVLSILALSILSYLVRLCSRQYSTHQHLRLEAEERKVMLKTYLALMVEGKLTETEDRKVALDTLFRPAQTGIVQDSASVIPSDTIVKIFDKQVKK
ncbi:hypothetical protein GV054_09265 [Marinomonas mediterranea]|uniref:DUF6161 domain-containing protein n=1 Tax=Marinomonas mediterranea TaxID=119864 RepID=UPI00234B5D8B|nr:DUF6161 domain-containing protein [Marinomonas mediterranea]WCN13183.1 hypothetical protein GV054_09265 [Marinomonas mediterranea]